CARLVSTEQCGLKREIAVAEHRDFERADPMTVDVGRLHACKWRSHTILRCLFESENPARCPSLVLATLDRPRFRGNSGHDTRAAMSAFGTKRTWRSRSAMSALGVKRTSTEHALMSACDSKRTSRRMPDRPLRASL